MHANRRRQPLLPQRIREICHSPKVDYGCASNGSRHIATRNRGHRRTPTRTRRKEGTSTGRLLIKTQNELNYVLVTNFVATSEWVCNRMKLAEIHGGISVSSILNSSPKMNVETPTPLQLLHVRREPRKGRLQEKKKIRSLIKLENELITNSPSKKNN